MVESRYLYILGYSWLFFILDLIIYSGNNSIDIMKTKINLIQCIENKPLHQFEENLQMFLFSMNRFNLNIFNHHIIQPSNFDISNFTKNLIIQNNINFTKSIINSKQVNVDVDYSLKPNIAQYYSHNLNQNEFMCLLDLDVIFINNIPISFPMTEKILFSIFPIINNIINDDIFFYQHKGDSNPINDIINYFSPNNKIKYYVNTFCIFGHTKHLFWNLWKTLTEDILLFINKKFYHLIKFGIESIAEELAATILYNNYPLLFDHLPNNLKLLYHPENTWHHYETFPILLNSKHNNLLFPPLFLENLLKNNIISIQNLIEYKRNILK